MYARVTSGPVAVEAVVEQFRGQQGQPAPAPATLPPGLVSRITLLDRANGTGMIISLWETAETLRATEAGHQRTLDLGLQAGLWTAPPTTEVYEVLQRTGQ